MSVPAVGRPADRTRPRVVPDRLAHVVLRTQQFEALLTWWANVLQADIAFKNAFIGFLAFDDEHHRVAIVHPADVGARPRTGRGWTTSPSPTPAWPIW